MIRKPNSPILGGIGLFLLSVLFAVPVTVEAGQTYVLPPGQQVIGTMQEYVIQDDEETLVDLALQHDLGYNEITAANPDLDPWYPGKGKRVILPTSWILPAIDDRCLDDPQHYFTVQVGSFSVLANAVRQYDAVTATMGNSKAYSLRIDKAGAYFGVRLGLFRDRDEAAGLLAKVRTRFAGALLLEVYFKPEQIVYPAKAGMRAKATRSRTKPCIVINLAEYRLYRISHADSAQGLSVMTFPIGIGRQGYETPVGRYHVIEKIRNPVWIIPESARADYPEYSGIMPPGPDNPLGDYALRLSQADYLIHGTARPLGIGRRVSHGCIRMYPADIEQLFNASTIGDGVVITYQPVKIGRRGSNIYVEVHQDYLASADVPQQAVVLLASMGLLNKIDMDTLFRLIRDQRGVPEPLAESPGAGEHW